MGHQEGCEPHLQGAQQVWAVPAVREGRRLWGTVVGTRREVSIQAKLLPVPLPGTQTLLALPHLLLLKAALALPLIQPLRENTNPGHVPCPQGPCPSATRDEEPRPSLTPLSVPAAAARAPPVPVSADGP